jgi:hypothetical protein
MPHSSLPIVLVLAGSLIPAAVRADWFSHEAPPTNAKSLSEIIMAVEEEGYETVTDVEFDASR